MSRPRLTLALLMIAAPACTQAARAQTVAPPAAEAAPHNGLEQNGLNYQPTQGGTVGREAAAGVRPNPQHQQRTDAELNQIDRQLLQSEGKNPDNAVSPTPK